MTDDRLESPPTIPRDGPRPAREPARRATAARALGALAWLVLIGLASVTAMGFLSRFGWAFELASHLRIQLALAALALLAVLLALGRRGAAWAALGLLLLNGLLVLPAYVPSATPSGTASPRAPASRAPPAGPPFADVLSFNVLGGNPNVEALAAFVETSGAELVLLLELRPPLEAALEAGTPSYELLVSEARQDNYGIALLRRRDAGLEVEAPRILAMDGAGDHPSVVARLRRGTDRAAFLGLHVPPPVSPAHTARRNRQLLHAGRWAAEQAEPAILAGDLNTTPWSWVWPALRAPADLRDSRRGFGAQATWPAPLPAPLRIPIDHLLHSPELDVTARDLGPALGADHRPLRVRLRMSAAASRDAGAD